MELSFLDTEAKDLRILNLLVQQHGTLLARRDWDTEIRRNQYSASKSFTSAAVGIAVKEGLLSLDERLTEAFPEELPENPCEALCAATVRDLLTMCLGQKEPLLMAGQRVGLREESWVRYLLAQPFSHMPGERFLYSNAGPYLAGVLVQRRCGCDLTSYLTPRLFAPLDIPRPTWESDPAGYTFGAGGLFLAVSELLRFGQLLLQDGLWNGRQLISADYVKEATGKRVENGGAGYGYLFWRGEKNSYRADGMYGQFAIVLPEKDAVLAVNAECREQNKLLDCLLEKVAAELS